jgi:addiction module HigA family antidote
MSVKEAAQRLGIGRPALSNFLNGKAALSPEMAVRLEKAFGADRQRLLNIQAAFDQQEQRASERAVAVRAFVPSFLTIKARQIEHWAETQIEARDLLAVLLRKLVHSTASALRDVDFPGYDNAQRKGSDGFVDADAATPWVPAGRSYWEFGTDQKPAGKAEKDYRARVASVDAAERASSTFVFVTPRNWPGRNEWESRKNQAGEWKAVRAFDASDLEQWLEQSVPAQIWLAEQLAMPVRGYETLEHAWRRWTSATKLPLTPEIFAPSLAAHRNAFKSWLEKPSDRPFVLAADSRDEALAFLACMFEDSELRDFRDNGAVFTSPETLRMLVASSIPFIPIVLTEEMERELGDAHQRLHCITFRSRNAVDTKADIALDLLGYDAFRKALQSMGVDESEVDRLATESGRSPTILRRRLSTNAAIKTPVWAGNDDTAKALVPMTLIGAWHTEPEADRKIVSRVADQEYEVIEDAIARLLSFDDSPVWSVGRYRGVASKIDALFAIARMVTSADLDRFFKAAEYVLSESDPALELPEGDRWAAALYGKKRDHSDALREGVCETLVLLSVHGNSLFKSRLGIDVNSRVAPLVSNLLTPLTLERLLSNDRNLPRYAEAAPEKFLSIIEEDLRTQEPVVLGLLKPVEHGTLWGSPRRAGLLWALECLAWKPENLLRVTRILARLSQLKIDDNWMNKPEASLETIFQSRMPQTAASLEQRIKGLEMLGKDYPDVAWRIAREQITPGLNFGHESNRPKWRSDCSGAGLGVTDEEADEFSKRAFDLMITWQAHDESTLGDLVESLQGKTEEDQTAVWDLIGQWAGTSEETAKAALRERIRRFALTQRGHRRKLGEVTRDRAREAYESLRPRDPVLRHGWLFADQWVQESVDELEDESFDHQKRDERIAQLRDEAIAEILTERGFEGVCQLLAGSGSAETVGRHAARSITAEENRVAFIRHCLSWEDDAPSKEAQCLRGFLGSIEAADRSSIIRAAANELLSAEKERLLLCAPFQSETWRLVDESGEDIRSAYWEEVSPSWQKHTSSELTELLDRLLDARRPRAAFYAVRMDFKDIETSRLKRLMRDIATVNAEPAAHFGLDAYHVSAALDSLDGRPGVTRDEMAHLELLFLGALRHEKHGIPNLESQIAESPAMFFHAVALAFKRKDHGEDPPELRIEDPEQRSAAATNAHRLLKQIKRVPGTKERGQIDSAHLSAWVAEVRRLCREHDRAVIGDQFLGQLLAKAPAGKDGMWPCEAVCQVIEEVASPDIATGFQLGVHNSRGAHFRSRGGDQERELAASYRARAERLHFDHPFVGAVLEDIASSYEREGDWHDSRAKVEERLGH